MIDQNPDPSEFRHLMAHWVTGVSVLTSDGGAGPCGCTANAVTSLSLEPARVLVCLHRDSNTLVASRSSGYLGVNFLSGEQIWLSSHFASKANDKFAQVPHSRVLGVPVLDRCLAWLVGEVVEELDGVDHAILMLRPVAGESVDRGEPLVFFRSGYHELRPRQEVPGSG